MNVVLVMLSFILAIGGIALSVYLFGRLPAPASLTDLAWIEAALPGLVGVLLGIVIGLLGRSRRRSEATEAEIQPRGTPNQPLDTSDNAELQALLDEYDSSGYVLDPEVRSDNTIPESQRDPVTGRPIPAPLQLSNRPPINLGNIILDPIIYVQDASDEPIQPPSSHGNAKDATRRFIPRAQRHVSEKTTLAPTADGSPTREIVAASAYSNSGDTDTDEFPAPRHPTNPTDEYDFDAPTQKLSPEEVANLNWNSEASDE